MSDTFDRVLAVVVVLIIVAVMALCIGAMVMTLTPWQCDRIAAVNTDLDFTWSVATGCMVQMPDGIWYSTGQVSYVGLETEP